MKVLWFCGNPGRYRQDMGIHESVSGAWIASLQSKYQEYCPDIRLALAFPFKGICRKDFVNNTTYYTIGDASFFQKLSFKRVENTYLERAKDIIDDFRPDIIQVFGSETKLGLIYRVTDIPIVLHIQGILLPYSDAWYPPKYVPLQELEKDFFNPKKLLNTLIERYRLKKAIEWETEMCSHIRYFMGRTEWDKRVIKMMSPDCEYFYCSEMLRDAFSCNAGKWCYPYNKKYKFGTTISGAIYKGADVILKTAKLLKKMNVDFEWNIFGVSQMYLAERNTKIYAKDVNVVLRGRTDADTLCKEIIKSNCYVHLSYIENSPNSVCEAQILGVPVVAANVGGVSSLIEHGKNGVLVPSNDAFTTAYWMQKLCNDPAFAREIGGNGTCIALNRHNPKQIVNNLTSIYDQILNGL